MFSRVTVIGLTVFAIFSLLALWLFAEFHWGRRVRVALGCLVFVSSFSVATIVGTLERFNSNAWFGRASGELIDAAIAQLEAGHSDRVLRTFRQLQTEYQPTYENRAQYDKLVEKAVAEMTSK